MKLKCGVLDMKAGFMEAICFHTSRIMENILDTLCRESFTDCASPLQVTIVRYRRETWVRQVQRHALLRDQSRGEVGIGSATRYN